MVAYSFKARFVEPIETRRKRHTIRADRKRHARAGEQLQLYYAQRTIHCRLIALETCRFVLAVSIDWNAMRIEMDGLAEIRKAAELDKFARDDGFTDIDDMREFWDAEHPGLDRFAGKLISWAPAP